MPIGDPMGGNAEYGGWGKFTRVWISAIQVSNLDDAVECYGEVLALPIQLNYKQNNWMELGREESHGKTAP